MKAQWMNKTLLAVSIQLCLAGAAAQAAEASNAEQQLMLSQNEAPPALEASADASASEATPTAEATPVAEATPTTEVATTTEATPVAEATPTAEVATTTEATPVAEAAPTTDTTASANTQATASEITPVAAPAENSSSPAVEAAQKQSVIAANVAAPTVTPPASIESDQTAYTAEKETPTTAPAPIAAAQADAVAANTAQASESVAAPVNPPVENTPSLAAQPTTSMNPPAGSAASVLQKKEGDASQETNLQEVFTSNERQYSLIKKGEISTFYDLDYTYYRDSRLDLGIQDGVVNQLRVEEDANHTYTNTISLQYGLKDNITLSASVPFVAKTDNLKDASTAGLGDISFGARWEPFPLKADRLPLILFGNLSTKTGDSPYEVNATRDLSTGKGYYSAGVGASTRKYIDPVVLFGSLSANYGFKQSDLNQVRGNRVISEFEPGISGGFAFGFAYSFNYDVSLTMSYQQSFNLASQFRYSTGESFKPADQTSSTFAIALGVRTSPETIVNGTLGIGLTEDAPDVSLGLSFPLDIMGLAKKDKKKQTEQLARGATQNASR